MTLHLTTADPCPDGGAPRRRAGFATRLALAISVFGVLMIGVYYGFVHRPLSQRFVELEEAEIRLLFRGLRNRIQDAQGAAMRELEALAALPTVRGFQKADLDRALTQAESTRSIFRKFTAMDINGTVVSRPSQASAVGEDRSDRGYFRGAMASGGLYFDEVRLFTGALSISIGTVIRGVDDAISGVLAGHIELTGQSPRLCYDSQYWSTRSKHDAFLLTSTGYKIAHSSGPLVVGSLADVDYRAHPLFRGAVTRDGPDQFERQGKRYYGIIDRIEPSGWLLLLQVERDPVIGKVGSVLNGVGLLLGMVFLGLLAAVGFYGARVIRPIQALTHSLASFGQIGGSRTLTGLKTVGEIDDAVQAFNRMVVERSQAESVLLQQRSELQELAGELSRVEQHTRREVAGELHDNISQALAAAKIRLELLLDQDRNGERAENLRVVIDLLHGCIVNTSQLTSRLSQPAVEQLGLIKALDTLVANYQEQHPQDFRFECEESGIELDSDRFDLLYRGVGELLHNTVKHARAEHVVIRLCREAEGIVIEVHDDGVGFVGGVAQDGDGHLRGYGLFGLRERIRHHGGVVEIASTPNQGSTVTVRIPITDPARSTPAPETDHDQDIAG